MTQIFSLIRGWRIAPKPYIYIYAKLTFWEVGKREVFDRFFNDFLIAFRYGFKDPLGGLDDIRVELWHPLEVVFS